MLSLAPLFDLLSPPSCASCDAELQAASVFCGPCAHAFVPAYPCTIDGLAVVAAGMYGGPLALAVQRLKFADRPDLARQLGELLRRAALTARIEADVIVPVPLHRKRLIDRGYNQSSLLAQRVRDTVPARLDVSSLIRHRHVAPQIALGAAERSENVRGAFTVTRRAGLRGRRILLIDDVVTTGATALACADALLAAGARTVSVLCVARAE